MAIVLLLLPNLAFPANIFSCINDVVPVGKWLYNYKNSDNNTDVLEWMLKNPPPVTELVNLYDDCVSNNEERNTHLASTANCAKDVATVTKWLYSLKNSDDGVWEWMFINPPPIIELVNAYDDCASKNKEKKTEI